MNMFNGSIDYQTDQFFESLPCHVKKPYPSADVTVKHKPTADLLLSVYADGGNSEFTAIAQYIDHFKTIENKVIADNVLCIALVEMHHLEMLGSLITSLGGVLRYWNNSHAFWSAGSVSYGNTTCEKLSLDIQSEQGAIIGYRQVLREIHRMKTPGLEQVEAVINRILEDEQMHLTMFETMYRDYCDARY